MNFRVRFSALTLLVSIALTCMAPGCVAAEQNVDSPPIFRSGFLQSSFSIVDFRDAKAVLEVNSREIARIMGLGNAYKVLFFADTAAMTTAFRNGELELAVLPAIEFMRMRKMTTLIPAFVNSENDGQGIRYVILTRKDSGIRSFSDLKGKSLLLPPTNTHEPSRLWLEVLLMKEGKDGGYRYFSQVKDSAKSSSAIMAVFFGQADAAIVTFKGFEISRQLNPQIGTKLTVLVESPLLVNEVICMTTATPESLRNRLSSALIQFGASKGGQQLFTIFQANGLTPFKITSMEGLEGLIREKTHLKSKTAIK